MGLGLDQGGCRGRTARVIPSGSQWNFLIDKPGNPNLLFSEPGNVIENSIQMEIGPLDEDPYTEILAEFRDVDDRDRPALNKTNSIRPG